MKISYFLVQGRKGCGPITSIALWIKNKGGNLQAKSRETMVTRDNWN